MDELKRIVFDIVTLLYPKWIESQRKKYPNMEEYKKIILDFFGYDIERAALEQEHNINISELERKIKIMKLNEQLKEEARKKKKEKR